jgi:hypothetical protein
MPCLGIPNTQCKINNSKERWGEKNKKTSLKIERSIGKINFTEDKLHKRTT